MLSSVLFAWVLALSLVQAAPWIKTVYRGDISDTHTYTYTLGYTGPNGEDIPTVTGTTTTSYTIPRTVMVTESTHRAISTATSADPGYATVVQLFVEGTRFTRVPFEDLNWVYVGLTYVAPTTCSPGWTTTTNVRIVPPENFNPATTGAFTNTYGASTPLVDPKGVGASSMSKMYEWNAPPWKDDCFQGPAWGDSTEIPKPCPTHDYYAFIECGIGFPALIGIIMGCWVAFCICLGIIESYIKFRRLCRGKAPSRGLPVAFSFALMPVTLLLLYFSKRIWAMRPLEERRRLRRSWDLLGGGQKFRLWLRYGFSTKYPAFLGDPPNLYMDPTEIAKRRNASANRPINRPPMASTRAAQAPPRQMHSAQSDYAPPPPPYIERDESAYRSMLRDSSNVWPGQRDQSRS